ncbi:MAG: nicotinate-nucleotide adenylyltransferase [Lachnospiraceae bacterium]|nr:nicotinate-nucleotide adenylyltransferase [Lachnospiraceae bacterium]
MRIGIIGGTFNPIHIGHLNIAESALKQCDLDEIWFMPNGRPPHKQSPNDVSNIDRLKIVKLAISGNPKYKLCDIEISKNEPCYTYLTMEELHRQNHDNHEFFFIIGEDSFWSFEKWMHPEIICKYTKIIIAKRPNWSDDSGSILLSEGELKEKSTSHDDEFKAKLEEYKSRYNQDFIPLNIDEIDISSSRLRRDIYNTEYVKQFIPERSFKYIYQLDLYKHSHEMAEIYEIDVKVKNALKHSRYVHTIGVMHTAANLAYRYDYPYVNAMLAGLLHDCAKCISDEERIDICKTHNIKISDIEMKFPHLLHGKAGSVLAKELYGINDEDILHSITWHTTGCPNMSLLDKIIYVADYIEPGRDKAPRLDDIRRMAYIDLDKCIYMILQDSIDYLSKHPDTMDQTTMDTYNYFKRILEDNENGN